MFFYSTLLLLLVEIKTIVSEQNSVTVTSIYDLKLSFIGHYIIRELSMKALIDMPRVKPVNIDVSGQLKSLTLMANILHNAQNLYEKL